MTAEKKIIRNVVITNRANQRVSLLDFPTRRSPDGPRNGRLKSSSPVCPERLVVSTRSLGRCSVDFYSLSLRPPQKENQPLVKGGWVWSFLFVALGRFLVGFLEVLVAFLGVG